MIEIFTDGSSNNTTDKKAGWAYAISPMCKGGAWHVFYGHLTPPSTNNIGEMMGVLLAMRKLLSFGSNLPVVSITTDSEYVRKGLIVWREKWERNGMPEKNVEIWYRLFETYDELKSKCQQLNIFWVKGHKDCQGNILADKWAGEGKRDTKINSKGPSINISRVMGDLADYLNM